MNTKFSPHKHTNVSDKLTINLLHKFFKEAFLPNSDEFLPKSTFAEFVSFGENKPGYLSTIENMTDNRYGKETYSILDLAAGNISFLQILLHQHTSHECSSGTCEKFEKDFAKKVRYVAVEKGFTSKFIESLEKLLSKHSRCFEFIPHQLDLYRDRDLDMLKKYYKDAPFDLIILSNTLHEIPPDAWPNILSIILDLLSNDGHFAFLDLTNPMTIDKIDSSYKRFSMGKSFWEADAIYCDRSDVQELIAQMELHGITALGHDHDISYWHVKAKLNKKTITSEQRKEAVSSFLSTFFKKRLDEWKKKSKEERDKVKSEFELSKDPQLFIFSALRYLCRCASDTRTRECLESLGLKETITLK